MLGAMLVAGSAERLEPGDGALQLGDRLPPAAEGEQHLRAAAARTLDEQMVAAHHRLELWRCRWSNEASDSW